VIGEVPAWFLGYLGPERVRSSPNSPSTRAPGPSPVLAESGRPLRLGVSKALRQDLLEERDHPGERAPRAGWPRGDRPVGVCSPRGTRKRKTPPWISSERRSILRVTPPMEERGELQLR
jgi:hypothetical protein